MIIRPYLADDAAACLAVFDSNVPAYFATGERPDFLHFLEQRATHCAFLVIEIDARIVACGGLAIGSKGEAGFCWGMVEQSRHRQGLGRQLALARLQRARAHPGVQRIELSTSQHSQDFYRRLGFRVTAVSADGHGPGLDAVTMELWLHDG